MGTNLPVILLSNENNKGDSGGKYCKGGSETNGQHSSEPFEALGMTSQIYKLSTE